MNDTSEDRDLAAIDNTQLSEDDWRDVCQAVSVLSADWRALARHLGLSASLIDMIVRENPSSMDECLSQVLKHWLRCNYSRKRNELPSWRTLAEAVKHLNTRLFTDIKKAHQILSNRVCPDDDGSRSKIEPMTFKASLPPRSRQPAQGTAGYSPTTLMVITVVAVVAITVSLGFTSYYKNHQVVTDDSVTKMSQRGAGDKASFRNFPHMNEKPTMNQLTILEREDGGNPAVRISERIGAKNSDVGTYLLKDDHGVIMETIRENARGNTDTINREIFRRWLAGSGALAEVLTILKGGMELVSTFTTQMSTFHSYLEQRCKAYPIDTSTGNSMSVVNQKLCELLHNSSTFTRPLVSTLTSYCERLESNPYSQANSSDLHEFATSHQRFVIYLETLTPYLQLSLQEESAESVCGAQLTDVNQKICQILPLLTGAFASLNEYINIIVEGPAVSIPATNTASCLRMLQSSLADVKNIVDELSDRYSTKIGHEYQLPTVSQKLNTTNECVVSVLGGISSTAHQLSGFLESNSEALSASLEQSFPNSSENKHQSSQQSVVGQLRTRATNFMNRLYKMDCPSSVPYTLAVYNAHSLSSSSESKQTLMKQVTANQEKLSKLEQDKEQLVLDLQLLKVKYEKEQKKVASLESELTSHRGQPLPDGPSSLTTSKQVMQSTMNSTLSGSVGSLSTTSADEDQVDDSVMIRKHFVGRIAELNKQVQDSDSKSSHYYAECRALHKQLNHNSVLRMKLAQDLQVATDAIQQLQDQLATTSTNYEKQLSTMSDHLCELNDKLLKQNEEIENLKRPSKGKRKGK